MGIPELFQTNEIQSGIKRVRVKFSGGERKPEDVVIGPGTTSAELLDALEMDKSDFLVGKGTADSIFAKEEPLYPAIADGENLYITPTVEAGE